MKILIIGGTGFISSRLTNLLLQKDHKVSIFSRGQTEASFKNNKNLHRYYGDRNKKDDLRQVLKNGSYDVVYDMVAYDGQQTEQAISVFKGKCGRFVHCSTISVYMISFEVQCPITEDQWQRKALADIPRSAFGHEYGINKRHCEEVLWQHHDEARFPVSVLRPVYVSGPGDPAKRDWFWIERLLDGKPLLVPGSGDFAFQSVCVMDAARAFAELLDKPQSVGHAYNVAGEEIFSLKDYLNTLAGLLKVEAEIHTVDQKWFDKQKISYNPAGDVFPFNTRRTAVFSLDKIKSELSFKFTPFSSWMPLTIQWFRDINKNHSTGYESRDHEIEVLKEWQAIFQQK